MKMFKKIGLVSIVLASFFALSCATPRLSSPTNNYSLEKRIVRYVRKNAIPGKQFLIDKVKEHDITILGETHVKKQRKLFMEGKRGTLLIITEAIPREEKLVLKSVSELKDVGLKYLAVEFPSNLKPSVEAYIKTGVKDGMYKKFEEVFGGGERALSFYLDMIRAAMDEGLKIVYIDSPDAYLHLLKTGETGKFESTRDSYMTNQIMKIIHEDKDAKILIHVGARHAIEKVTPGNPLFLGSILDQKFDCYSIHVEPLIPRGGHLPKKLYRTTKNTIGFDIDVGPVAELEGWRESKTYGDAFDGIILFPKDK